MKRKPLTINEIFCGASRLKEYFQEMDRAIKTFSPIEGKSVGVEELKQKRKALLQTFKEMNRTDLQLLYYVHHFDRIYPHTILNAIKKLFAAQSELKNLLSDKKETANLFQE